MLPHPFRKKKRNGWGIASARVTLDTYTQAITDKKRRAQTKVVRLLVGRETRKK